MKIKSILCGLFAAAAVIACQEEPLVTPALEVTPESASVDATGGTVEISVTSNVDWTVDLSEDWIKSDPQSGKASDKAVKVVVTVDPNDGEERTAVVTVSSETLTGKVTIRQDAKADDPEPPVTDTFAEGDYWIMDGAGKVVCPIAENDTYGYWDLDDAVQSGESYVSYASYGFKFTAVEGGFTIQDTYGRHHYMTDYNSFSVSVDAQSDSSHVWSVSKNDDGTYAIVNTVTKKTVQLSSYGNYAPYAEVTGALPVLVKVENAVAEPEPAQVPWTLGVNDDAHYQATEEVYHNGAAETVPALKLGSSSKAGVATIVIPAGTTTVSFYAVGWKNKTSRLDFTSELIGSTPFYTIYPVGNGGASGNSPYSITTADTDKIVVDVYSMMQYFPGVGVPCALPVDLTVTLTTTNTDEAKSEVNDYRAILWGFEFGTDVPETPQPVASEWGIIGTITDWSSDITLYEDGDYYVAEDVALTTNDAFKFRKGGKWASDGGQELTAGNSVQPNTVQTAIDGVGNGDIRVTEDGTYDIYLSKNLDKFYVMSDGKIPADATEPVAMSEWALVGTHNNWAMNGEADTPMYDEGDYWVAKSFELAEDSAFKFRKNRSWADGECYGANTTNKVAPNTIQSTGGSDVKVSVAGTYDVYLSKSLDKYYIMSVGKTPAEATDPTPTEDTYDLIGCIVGNYWVSGVDLAKEGDLYVAKNVEFELDSKLQPDPAASSVEYVKFLIRKNASWDHKYGYATEQTPVNPNTEIAAVEGGNDFFLDGAGTYDVYFDPVNLKVWAMTPGLKPGETPETPAAPAIEDGAYWIIADKFVAVPLSANFGYLNVEDAVANGDVMASTAANAFTFKSVEGGYTIQDSNGKYVYMKGTYNSFNVSESLPSEGHVWSVAKNDDGTYCITNVLKGKYIQYSKDYSSYGAYDSEKGAMPVLVKADNPVEPETPEVTEGVLWTIGSENQTWTEASHDTYGAGYSATVDGITVSYYKYGNTNDARTPYADHIRVYKGSALVISAEGKNITKVVIETTTSQYASDITVDGTVVSPDGTTITWEGKTASFEAIMDAGQVRVKTLNIVTE